MSERITEQTLLIRDVPLACKIWQPEQPVKVLALHGWLDNAASFNRLAPLLDNCCVVAPDLAGQGRSGHRPASATYHLWDDVLDALLIADQLGWQQFATIGHSRGAMLASMLAASVPERICQLILLDGIMPLPVEDEQSATQLRRYLDDYRHPKSRHYFADRDSAIRFRAKASGFEPELAGQLAERQLQQDERGWYWHIDERLKAASAVKMSQARNLAFLQAIQCPVHVFLANNGLAKWPGITALKPQFADFHWYETNGHHHVHMTDAATEIARLCRTVLSSF